MGVTESATVTFLELVQKNMKRVTNVMLCAYFNNTRIVILSALLQVNSMRIVILSPFQSTCMQLGKQHIARIICIEFYYLKVLCHTLYFIQH